MNACLDVVLALIEGLEKLLFRGAYTLFYLVWNVLGFKWIFRAFVAVIEQSDAKDQHKLLLLQRSKVLQSVGGAA